MKFDLKKLDFKKIKIDRNNILIGIAVIGIIVTGVLIFANSNNGTFLSNLRSKFFGQTPMQIGQKAVDFVNNSKLAKSKVALKSAVEESGLIKISIEVGGQSFDSYVTKDGKFLFATPPITITAVKASGSQNNNSAASQASTSVKKTANSTLEAFVVSSCPYGLQMQRAIADAVITQPSLAQYVKIRYIGAITNGKMTSMHDADASGNPIPYGPEAQENLRQICIRQEQPEKFYNYLACYMQKQSGTIPNGMPLGDSAGCLASTGVDAAKASSCMADSSRGLAYAQVDFNLGTKYNVQGSPTLVLNGATINESNYGGRSSDGVKSMVCAGMNTAAGFCSAKLKTAEAAVSFSATYASSGASGTGGNTQCGT
jgi:hypothetical protein